MTRGVRLNRRKDIELRFFEKIDLNHETGCWEWTGGLSGPGRKVGKGYGVIGFAGGRGQTGAHRMAYRLFVGPIPDALDLDHLCRVRYCVNPAHLEPVTRKENLARGVGGGERVLWAAGTCRRGHDITNPANVNVNKTGRQCRVCKNAVQRERWHAIKAKKGK